MSNKENTKRATHAFMLVGLISVGLSTTQVFAQPYDDESHELESFWEEMGVLDVDEVVTQDMLTATENELLKLSNEISNNVVELEKLETNMKKKQREIKKSAEEIDKRVKNHSKRMEHAANQAITLQMRNTGKIGQIIDVIVNAESITDAIGKSYAINQLSDANKQLMQELKQEEHELIKIKGVLRKEERQLRDEKVRLEEFKEKLQTQKEQLLALQEEMEVRWELQEAEKAKLEEQQLIYLEQYQEQVRFGSRAGLDIVDKAVSYLGVPYLWGGMTAEGFDCSGFVQYVFADAGVRLPRVAKDQSKQGEEVSFKDLRAGDLLFWGREGESYHVGIYMGDGKYVHAPKPGDNVKITKLSDFTPDFAKRVLPEDSMNSEGNSFKATYYSAYDGTQIGITAGGTNMANGNILTKDGYRIVAVDPRVIPLGTVLHVRTENGESFLAKADDTGGMIKGNIIDIAVSSPKEAIRLGRTTATVEIIN